MKLVLQFLIAVSVSFTLVTGLAEADTKAPAEGSVLPQFSLVVPKSPEHQQYLGIAGKKSFAISEIDAEVVIIEIFSMY